MLFGFSLLPLEWPLLVSSLEQGLTEDANIFIELVYHKFKYYISERVTAWSYHINSLGSSCNTLSGIFSATSMMTGYC